MKFRDPYVLCSLYIHMSFFNWKIGGPFKSIIHICNPSDLSLLFPTALVTLQYTFLLHLIFVSVSVFDSKFNKMGMFVIPFIIKLEK